MLHTGRHFLQIPGPTNVPDRVLRAMDRPVIDHRGLEFAQLGAEVLEGLKSVFKTKGPVVIYPSSGSGAWEAAIVNTLSPGDRVLMVAQFEDKSPVNPQARWTAILTRFVGEDTDRLFNQDLFFLDGGAADSLLYVNQSVPPDSLFCRRILQPGPTTLAEVKTVLAEMAATPAKKTP